jgi:hypothetical protein
MSNEFDEYDRGSFQLDHRAKSFQMTGFRWRDAPVWLLLLGVFLGFPVVIGFGMSFLNREAQLWIGGMCLGYIARGWIEAWGSTLPAKRPSPDASSESPELSERVKAIADDPDRFIEAIKAYREESGAGLADAKSAVEAYVHRESQPW